MCIDCEVSNYHLSGPLNDLQLHIINDLGYFLNFFWLSSFYVSFELIKIWASSPKSMQILDSSLNITFIQLSTHHDCLSLAQFNLMFSRLCFRASFPLAFFLCKSHFTQPISNSSTTNIDFYLDPFVVFYLFCNTFSIFRIIAFIFLVWRFDVFRHHHYHHHVVPPAWISPTLSHYASL